MHFTQIAFFSVVLTDQPVEDFNAAFHPRRVGLAKASLGTQRGTHFGMLRELKAVVVGDGFNTVFLQGLDDARLVSSLVLPDSLINSP